MKLSQIEKCCYCGHEYFNIFVSQGEPGRGYCVCVSCALCGEEREARDHNIDIAFDLAAQKWNEDRDHGTIWT